MSKRLQHTLELLIAMTGKELKARYKNTIFGFLWLFVNPLLQMLIIGFIFNFFMKQPIKHYNFYLFNNLLIWNFFSSSINKCVSSIVYERSLIKKSRFPQSVIPLSIILSNFINTLAALGLFSIVIILIKTINISNIYYVLIGLLLLLIFTAGLSLLTCALNVKYRDIAFFTQAILTVWFYATPIVYSINQIPKNYIWMWRFNPLTSILQLLQHGYLDFPMPGPAMLASNIIVIMTILIIGIFVFKNESKYFDDWL